MKTRLLLCFFAVFLILLCAGAVLILGLRAHLPGNTTASAIAHPPPDISGKEVSQVLRQLQYRIVWVMLLICLGVMAVIFFSLRGITRQLRHLAKITEKMAEGRLDEKVRLETRDELGEIGEFVNDMAMNLQEALLHIWSHAVSAKGLLDQIDASLRARPDVQISPRTEAHLRFVRKDLQDMQDMVRNFEFYDLQVEDGKLMERKGS